MNKPAIKAIVSLHFNERVQIDLFFMFEKIWLIMIDECIRYRIACQLASKQGQDILRAIIQHWIRYFGPMENLVTDQEGGLTSDNVALVADRYNITLVFGGADGHTTTGLAERAIQTVKLTALKTKRDVTKQGLTDITDADIVEESAMVANLFMNYGGSVPAQGLFGYMPRDAYDPEAETLTASRSAMDLTPDPTEQHLRLRLLAKSNILQAIIEERIAKANNTRQQAQDKKLDRVSQTS